MGNYFSPKVGSKIDNDIGLNDCNENNMNEIDNINDIKNKYDVNLINANELDNNQKKYLEQYKMFLSGLEAN